MTRGKKPTPEPSLTLPQLAILLVLCLILFVVLIGWVLKKPATPTSMDDACPTKSKPLVVQRPDPTMPAITLVSNETLPAPQLPKEKSVVVKWWEYHPLGCVHDKGILRDVLSRCDERGRRTAYEPDQVTYCHEATHMLNSRIRNSMRRANVNVCYVGEGKCVVLEEPKVTLSQVARFVKPRYRNSTFQLYFVEARQWWNNQPLYILDEWSAYCNGSQAANELGVDEHGSHDRSLWFCHYADCVVRATRTHDPNYQEIEELEAFVDWQKKRAAKLASHKSHKPVKFKPTRPPCPDCERR